MNIKRFTINQTALLLFLLSAFLSPCNIWGEEEKKNDYMSPLVTLTQVEWINNNEILIAQRADTIYRLGDRIIKYNVRENKYYPVYNANFERREILGFSKDGRTFFIFDMNNDVVYLKRDGKVIYQKDMSEEIRRIVDKELCEYYSNSVTPIVVRDDWAIAEFMGRAIEQEKARKRQLPIKITRILYINVKDNLKVKPYLEMINSKEGSGSPSINLAALFKQVVRRNDDLIFITSGYAIYSLSLKDFSLKRLIKYQEEKEDFLIGKQIIKSGDKIYFTAIDISPFAEKRENNETFDFGDLFVYDLKSEKVKCYRKDVSCFDISGDYFVMTSSLRRYEGQLFVEEKGRILVQNRDNKCLYTKEFQITPELNHYPPYTNFIPTISPDGKRIVIFRNYGRGKPVVINTDEF